MEIKRKIIPDWESTTVGCKICEKQATDEIVINERIHWYLCFEHKKVFDLMLAFQDLIH